MNPALFCPNCGVRVMAPELCVDCGGTAELCMLEGEPGAEICKFQAPAQPQKKPAKGGK